MSLVPRTAPYAAQHRAATRLSYVLSAGIANAESIGAPKKVAHNYNPTATFSGYCEMPIPGCMSPLGVRTPASNAAHFPFNFLAEAVGMTLVWPGEL